MRKTSSRSRSHRIMLCHCSIALAKWTRTMHHKVRKMTTINTNLTISSWSLVILARSLHNITHNRNRKWSWWKQNNSQSLSYVGWAWLKIMGMFTAKHRLASKLMRLSWTAVRRPQDSKSDHPRRDRVCARARASAREIVRGNSKILTQQAATVLLW